MKLAIFLSLVSLSSAYADTKGLNLAKTLRANAEGFGTERVQMELKIIDSHGTEIKRIINGLFKEAGAKKGTKSLMTFLNPQDVKGTKLLTWTEKGASDKQWLYMPKIKRTKKITSSSKESQFMGSEFTYEDLGSVNLENYEFKIVKEGKDKKFGDVWVLERTPKKRSGYSKVVSIISKSFNAPVKVEYFDRKGEILKVATIDGYKKYTAGSKKFFRPESIQVENIQTKKRSILSWNKRQFGVSVHDRAFRKNNLK